LFDLGSTLIEYEVVSWDELGARCAGRAGEFLVKRNVEIGRNGQFEESFNAIRDGYRKRASEQLIEWDVIQVASDLFDKFGVSYDDEFVNEFFDAYYEPVAELLYVYDDAVDTLRRLTAHYPVMGLISNTVFPERVHRSELERFGLAPFLKFAIFSSSFGLRKPHPDIFLKAANQAGCATSECVYIGDRYMEDIQGPVGVGMPAILKVKPDREYPAEMPEAVRRINTLSELCEHIEM
jgi:FMN phosphatase YigB (HAD superfamily)